ncbi:MAG: branched-chain amino acid transport system II carrier protein [Absicoccus sp.]|uniref:branched-chain amino acid transport system II carrier protein n=1 Tax=Absicoccus sp. TaxID=2718527 RepID=UPI002A764DC7|nr:branched-chain amino acid transport system II carrier protein [Absicoccus sp.]MDY3034975.1 branched-chain amino acid transport system II carrier protein [Absicoccus sp.]
MKKHLTKKEMITLSSMLFGLFFGAGNLIFPAYLGQQSGTHIVPAVIGFLITGVGMPLLAVASLGITGSHGLLDLSSRIHPRFGFLFTCLLYLTIGPFFAAPRCVTVPFEMGFNTLFTYRISPQLALFLFSLLFTGVMLWFSLRPGKIMDCIGKLLNPLFLFILSILLIQALSHPYPLHPSTKLYATAPMMQGILNGYNTMDVLAGLAFGIIVVQVIQQYGITDPKAIANNTLKAGILCSVMMAIIYILTAVVGAYSLGYSTLAGNGGIVLSHIAVHFFSQQGMILLATIVLFACLKTDIGLATSFSTTFHEMFPSISYKQWVFFFSGCMLLIANLGLDTIIQYSVPILMLLYPLAIMLVLLSLTRTSKVVARWTMSGTLIGSLIECIRTLPFSFGWITYANAHIPLFQIGFGWLYPMLIGLILGCIFKKKKRKENKI